MAPTTGLDQDKKQEISVMNDLDSATTSRAEFNRSKSINFAVLCRPATLVAHTIKENDDSNAIVEAKTEKFQGVLEENSLDDFYLPEKDIPCLCLGSSSSNDNEVEHYVASTSLDQELPAKSPIKTWKSSGKGKKRKKIKGSPKRKPHKRQKTDIYMRSVSLNLENNLENSLENRKGLFTFNILDSISMNCKKTVGDGKRETTHKGGSVATQQSSGPAAKGKMCSSHFRAHSGGGGGDGGDGGDKKPPKKPPEDEHCRSPVIPKHKKKKTSDMEVDTADDSRNAEGANPPLEGTANIPTNDQEMTSECHSEYQQRPPVPERQKQQQEQQQQHQPQQQQEQQQQQQHQQHQQQHVNPTEQFLMWFNASINHFHYNFNKCKNGSNCLQCKRVEKMFVDHFFKMNGSCHCKVCQLALRVKNYHARLCHIQDCRICSGAMAVQQPAAAQAFVRGQQHQHQLNVPVCQKSLDQDYHDDPDDCVMWKDKSFPEEVRHFKEDVHYMISKNGLLGKGGHGSVHDLFVEDTFKKKYFNSDINLVMKKAASVEDDEKYVFENVGRHPNFVKTYLVLQKTGSSPHCRIIMEKCEKSVKDYLSELVAKGEHLKMHEAMFYWTQTLDAVKYLHNLRIPAIHKDIKAENVLLSVMDNLVRVKLADFDTVKRLHHEFTPHGLPVKGTPGLIAPEVLRQISHGRPADMWNMGMFLLQLLFPFDFTHQVQIAIQELRKRNGNNPFTFIHDTERVIRNFNEKKIPVLEKIDGEVAKVILACLDEAPEKRPTASNVLDNPAVVKYMKYMNQKINMEKLIQKICPNK